MKQNNMEKELTTIYLNEEDAKLFLEFRKNQDDFMILKANGIFSLKNGNMLIHKDLNGRVREIVVNQILFKI